MPPKSSPGTYKLYLLGAFHAENEKGSILLSARKVQSLLAFLVLHPEEHSREKLAALLWGDSPNARARDSLRTALKTLRQLFGDELLLTDREHIQLNSAFPLWADVREFEKTDAASVGGLSSSVALYRGDLLADSYDDWILPEREQFRELYLDALLQLTQIHRAMSEYERAMDYAHQVLAADPANERAHQHLMFCNLALGDRSAALQQYETCVRALQTELAVEPSRETTALYEWIRQASSERPSLAAQITNLPIPLASFIGRKRELAELKQAVAGTRLLTLTGAGGSGKTRLAIQVATDLIDRFHDGVWWVDFSALIDETLVSQAVAQALGVREIPNQALTTTLTNHLREKHLLLVLDNCEHLVAACARLADDLLTHCANLRILDTSREALGITGESVYQVPTLSQPTLPRLTLTNLLLEFESIRLFVERARAVQSDFRLTEQNAAAVLEICRRLDGIPLAIELAAARTKLLTVEHIAERLNDRFNLLTHGSRTAFPRQQTLRAALDWSYDLLPEEARRLFRRLSVFAGGFALEAAENICSEEPLTPRTVLEQLARLVDRSLLKVEQQGDDERYWMLETIREYAREKLLGSDESERIDNLHLDFFLKFAQDAEPHLLAAEAPTWFNRVQADWDNVRLALNWSLKSDHGEKGLRIAGALKYFAYSQGYLHGFYQALLELLKAQSTARRTPALANGYFTAGIVAVELGNFDDARPLYETSLAILREAGAEGRGLLETVLSYFAYGLLWSEPRVAARYAEEAVALCRESGNREGLAMALGGLAQARGCMNEIASARLLLDESATLAQEMGDQFHYLFALIDRGIMVFYDGELDAAKGYLEASNSPWMQSQQAGPAMANTFLGAIARLRGQWTESERLLQESVRTFREIGNRRFTSLALGWLGRLELDRANTAAAERCFREALFLAREANLWINVPWSLESLAYLYLALNQPRRSVQLLGAAGAWREELGTPLLPVERQEYESAMATAHAQFDSASFNAAWAEGRTMPPEQAVEYALEQVST